MKKLLVSLVVSLLELVREMCQDLRTLSQRTDYYFLIYTTDPTGCGEFEFTTTGVYMGCTDATANNYDPQATMDDGFL